MTDEEHKYFHKLMAVWERSIEPKFAKGAKEHRHESNLWDMTDEALEQEIQNEIKDLSVYLAEKLRREHERKT